MRIFLTLALSLGLLLTACETSTLGVDAGPVVDAAASVDAAALDAGADAGPIEDAGMVEPDAAPTPEGDAAQACHGLNFGAPAVDFERVLPNSLPEMTGGAIPLGIYDAVQARRTGTLGTSYRATWEFVAGAELRLIQQLNLTGSAPTPTPRTHAYSVEGNMLHRTPLCAESSSFDNSYRVYEEGGATYLDVLSAGGANAILFTFRLQAS